VRNGDDKGLGKQRLKKSAWGCYKRGLPLVSLQTIQDRAVCKTQAGNVFRGCLTKPRVAAGTNEMAPESDKHEDAATGGIVLGQVVPFSHVPKLNTRSIGSLVYKLRLIYLQRRTTSSLAMTEAEQLTDAEA
jgi:hypothetical protein